MVFIWVIWKERNNIIFTFTCHANKYCNVSSAHISYSSVEYLLSSLHECLLTHLEPPRCLDQIIRTYSGEIPRSAVCPGQWLESSSAGGDAKLLEL